MRASSIKSTQSTLKVSALLPLSLALAIAAPTLAHADPLPYGPDTCIQGLVWREARSGDTVCVTPDVRSRTATENAHPGSNKDPLAGSGPDSCSQGYVWREAFDGDTICVTPGERSETLAANAAAASNRQANQPDQQSQTGTQGQSTVVLTATGSGRAITVDTDPAGPRAQDVPLPFSRTMKIGPDVQLLQVVVVGGDNAGCQITLDGKVVVDQSSGGNGHCVFSRF
ncbi:MAG: hypothetical protein JWR11_3085 [Mycobacterium sp.]|jgi:hypothetical protein|nr:hypothetical protein [Mycobacterium sp.]MDT5178197.1 hypothetical protein [Mycobacterium sp.]